MLKSIGKMGFALVIILFNILIKTIISSQFRHSVELAIFIYIFAIMVLSKDIINKIIGMGATGSSLLDVAMLLNTTPDQLRDERKTNERLENALERFEYNHKQYLLSKIEKSGLNMKAAVQREIYKTILEGEDKGNDNEIIIRRV